MLCCANKFERPSIVQRPPHLSSIRVIYLTAGEQRAGVVVQMISISFSGIHHPEFETIKRILNLAASRASSLSPLGDESKVKFTRVIGYEPKMALNDEQCTPAMALFALYPVAGPLFPSKHVVDILQWTQFAFGPEIRSFIYLHPENGGPLFMLNHHLGVENKKFICGEEPSISDVALFAVLLTRISAGLESGMATKAKRVMDWMYRCAKLWDEPTLKEPTGSTAGQGDALSAQLNAKLSLDKKGSTPKEPKAKPKAAPEPEVELPLFARLDIRIGRIKAVSRHPTADRLYIEQVDLGEAIGEKTIVSGLVEHVPAEMLQDRLAPFVCNLKPAMLCKVKSEGMILVAKNVEAGLLELIPVPEGASPGDRVTLQGLDMGGSPEAPVKIIKTADWDIAKPKLVVTDGQALFDGQPLLVNGNPIKGLSVVQNGIIS